MLKLGVRIYASALTSRCLSKPIANDAGLKNASLQSCQSVRNASFFTKLTAEQLWKGVTSVSNAGKKRGRGKGTDKKGKKNLNIGQQLGVGTEKIMWPGLSAPLIVSNTVMKIRKNPEMAQSVEKLEVKLKRKKRYIHPLERGWSGKKIEGRSLGPPNQYEEKTFQDFDSVIIEHKLLSIMTAIMGRKRKFTATALVGNGKGLIGMAKGYALESNSAINQARNKAMKHLLSFDFAEKNTVNHDFYSQFGKTKIFVFKKPEGYGLNCHRVIKVCCKLIGIKDLAAKVEGSMNVKHIIKGFLIGLMRQKTYQEIADENNLHLIECRREALNFPKLLASPKVCLTPEESRLRQVTYEDYIWEGKVVYRRPRKVPFYEKLPGWQKHLKESTYKRNHNQVRIDLLCENGGLKSFLSDRYPECHTYVRRKQKEAEEAS